MKMKKNIMYNNMFELHAVLINNKYPIEEAREMAKKFIKNKRRKFYRETKNTYRFKNLDKKYFVKGSFRTKKINDDISLIYSELLPEYEHMKGSGLSDFLKSGFEYVKNKISKLIRSDDYTNRTRDSLKKYGDVIIKDIVIGRTPISDTIHAAFNAVSMGKWNEQRQKLAFDKLYHLFMVVTLDNNIKLIVEKLQEINVSQSFKIEDSTEWHTPEKQPDNMTLNQCFNDTLKRVGKQQFFTYSSFNNNCQKFVSDLLITMNIYDEDTKDFVQQDLEELIREMPSYVSSAANLITDVGNIGNQLIGEGKDTQLVELTKKEYTNFLLNNNVNKKPTKREHKKYVDLFFKSEIGKQLLKKQNEYNKRIK
jgi:hypothetical protein